MNILMIYPKQENSLWTFKDVLKIISKKAAYPPLGLLTVAGMLPNHWNLRLTDLNIEPINIEYVHWANYIMIGAILSQEKSVYDIIELCKKMNKRIIAGGSLFRIMHNKFSDLVDHMMISEAENLMPRLIADLEKGSPKKIYEDRGYPSLKLTPIPRWDLIDINQYANMMVQTNRGCPYLCEFCSVTELFGNRMRTKGIEQVIFELDALYKMGWRGEVLFVDDNFIGNKKFTHDLLIRIKEWQDNHAHPFTFSTQASINLADDDDLIELMVDSGIDAVFVGLETPDPLILMENKKNQNFNRDLVLCVQKLHLRGIQVFGSYIIGFDSDRTDIFSRQLEFIHESGVPAAMVHLLNAIPHTKLWYRLKEEGRVIEESFVDDNQGGTNIISKMDRDYLLTEYKKMMQTLYKPKVFYRRTKNFINHFNPRSKTRFDATKVKALLKSMFHVGIAGGGSLRWYYWKMFFYALCFRPRLFTKAITLMTFSLHYRRYAQNL